MIIIYHRNMIKNNLGLLYIIEIWLKIICDHYIFITKNKGYTKVTVNANDCYVVDSTQFADDDFDCDEILSGKFLTFTNSKNEGSYTNGKFLTVYENSLEREKNRGLFGRILTFC